MASFCGKCGASVDNDAKVCGQCGNVLDESQGKIPGVNTKNPEKAKKIAKKIKLVVGLIIIGLIGMVAINIVLNFTGSKGFVRKVMTAYKKYDIDTLIELSSDVYYYGYENEAEAYFEYEVSKRLEEYENLVGHDYKLSYEIDEIYELSKWKEDEMIENLVGLYSDFDERIIEEILIADVDVTLKEDKKTVERNLEITMTKEDGEWKLLYIK